MFGQEKLGIYTEIEDGSQPTYVMI